MKGNKYKEGVTEWVWDVKEGEVLRRGVKEGGRGVKEGSLWYGKECQKKKKYEGGNKKDDEEIK